MVREGKERERDFLFDTDISLRHCRLVIYNSVNRGTTASTDINSLDAGDFGGGVFEFERKQKSRK